MKALVSQLDQALLISVYEKFGKLEIRSPMLNCHDNSQVFLFVSTEATAMRTESLTEICKRMAILNQHCPNAVSACISFDTEGLGEIEKGQHWGRDQCRLQGLKGLFMGRRPVKH